MKWCCRLFESKYQSAGERGLSVLVGRDSFEKPEFIVQHRSADIEVKEVPATDYPIAWISETRIFCCPWCGKHLEEQYEASIDSLIRRDFAIKTPF